MAWIRKTPHDRYRVVYRDPTGRERSKTFRTKAEARQFVNSVETDVDLGTWTDPKLQKTLLGEWVEEWWPTTLHLRPSTRARDEAYLKNYVLPEFENYPLGRITPIDIRHWVAGLHDRGFAPATTRKAYQLLSKILREAVGVGLLPQSPCRGISLPRIEIKEMRFLNPQEVQILAGTIPPRYRAFVLLGAYGGLRWAELVGLTKSRFDEDAGTVDIAEIVVELDGGTFLPPSPPKTKAGRRRVRLPQGIVEELRNHIDAYCLDSSEYVFQTQSGTLLRKGAFRTRVWLPAVEAAGLAPFRIHDLRHTAISFWISAGDNAKAIAARAGHTSTSVVLDRYGHVFPDDEDRLMDALDKMFHEGPGS